MAAITLRSAKGSALTNAEVDTNFTNLNTELGLKLIASNNLSDLGSAATARSNLGLGNVENKSSAIIRGELTSSNVTTALGYTPLSNATSYLPLSGGTLTGASTVSVSTWAKWTLETTGVTAKARQGSDGNGLNFTSNAQWTGSAWAEDDSTKKKFAYIQHLGNGRHEFRTSPTGTGVTWTTSLTVDESAVNSTVALTQSGNQVLNASNYSSYAVPLSGGTMSGALRVYLDGASSLVPQLYWANAANNRAWNWQLDESNSAALWGYDGTSWAKYLAVSSGTTALNGSRLTFKSAIADGGSFALIGLNWDGGTAGTYKDFEVYDYINSRTMFRLYGSTRNVDIYGSLAISGYTALHAGNYNSYAMSGAGYSANQNLNTSSNVQFGTVTLTTDINLARNDGTTPALVFQNLNGLRWIYSGGGNYYNVNLGVNSSNQFTIGGNTTLHAGNYTSYSPSLTGSGASGTWNINITGSAGSVAWGNVSGRPYWMPTSNLIYELSNFNTSVPSGFYQGYNVANSPSGTWYNLVNVRHSNTANDHGFQMAMSYYDENFWTRSYQGGTGNSDGTFTAWRAHLHAGNYSSYALPLSGGTVDGVRIGSWTGGSTYKGIYYTGMVGSEYMIINRGDNTYISAVNGYSVYIRGGANSSTYEIGVSGSSRPTVGGNVILDAGNSQNYKSRSLYSSRTSNVDFNSLNTAVDTFVAGTNYIPNGGAYNQPVDGDHHYLSWGGIEGANVWGAQIDINFYDDRMWFRRQHGSSWQGWRSVLHDGNYTSYSPSLTGSGASGTWGINITGSAGSAANITGGNQTGSYEVTSGQYTRLGHASQTDGNDGKIGAGLFGTGLNIVGTQTSAGTGRQVRIWGSVITPAGEQFLHSGNYNSYAPSLTGSGASGTWSISISGTSRGVVTSDPAIGTGGLWVTSGTGLNVARNNTSYVVLDAGNYTGYSGVLRVAGFAGTTNVNWNSLGNTNNTIYGIAQEAFNLGTGSGNTNYPTNASYSYGTLLNFSADTGNSAQAQIYISHAGGDLIFRGGWYSNSWQPWSKALTHSNYSSYALPLSGGSLTGRLYTNNWIEFTGYQGLYEANNAAYFYSNNASYGAWRVAGSRNGWGGISFDGNNGIVTLMMNPNSDHSGFHNNNYGWQFYWAGGTMHCFKSSYGGGTDAIVLDSANYTSYALPLSGGTVTGPAYFRSNPGNGVYLASVAGPPLQAYSNDGGAAYMSFHRSGAYAVNFGLDPDNILRIGGWSAGANRWSLNMSGDNYAAGNFYANNANLVLHAGNYTSYSPSLTGSGASGSWGISVTGSARLLDSAHYIARTGTSGNLNTDFQNVPAGSMRHAGDDPYPTNNPGGTWWFYDHYRHSNSSNYWGTQVAWGWEDNSCRLAQRNVSGNSWSGWVYYLNSGNYSSYALPLSGGTVTGKVYLNGGYPGPGSDSTLRVNGDITVSRGGSDGVIYFGESGSRYLYLNQSSGYYQFAGAAVSVTGMLVGTTNDYIENKNAVVAYASGTFWVMHASGTASGNTFSGYSYNGNGIGSITQNGTTGVSYNTSSDYRLKNITGPMVGALARNRLLEPEVGTWKEDGSPFEGFVAHKLQAVFPQAVHGIKDEVDAQGKPVYQGVGTGPLDAHFAACVNELIDEIEAMKAEIAALKAALH